MTTYRTLPEINDAIGEALVASQVAAEKLVVAARHYRFTQATLVRLREEAQHVRDHGPLPVLVPNAIRAPQSRSRLGHFVSDPTPAVGESDTA